MRGLPKNVANHINSRTSRSIKKLLNVYGTAAFDNMDGADYNNSPWTTQLDTHAPALISQRLDARVQTIQHVKVEMIELAAYKMYCTI